MKAQHTLGEWKSETYNFYGGWTHRIYSYIGNSVHRTIAFVGALEGKDDLNEEDITNAQIISAAPDMLLVLRLIKLDENTQLSIGVWSLLEETLAKAEGNIL